jgi:hypothetical protein
VDGKRSSSIEKTYGACHRAGPTTLVVVKVVVLKTGTNAKSTKHVSTRTLHYIILGTEPNMITKLDDNALHVYPRELWVATVCADISVLSQLIGSVIHVQL